MRKQPWPWPGDTVTDRARRVAGSYRSRLLVVDPMGCSCIDTNMIERGETWVVPQQIILDEDERVTVDVAAERVGRSAATVYKWIYNRRLKSYRGADNRVRVRLGDALDMHRDLRIRRAS